MPRKKYFGGQPSVWRTAVWLLKMNERDPDPVLKWKFKSFTSPVKKLVVISNN